MALRSFRRADTEANAAMAALQQKRDAEAVGGTVTSGAVAGTVTSANGSTAEGAAAADVACGADSDAETRGTEGSPCALAYSLGGHMLHHHP